jgi:hypothetical protein
MSNNITVLAYDEDKKRETRVHSTKNALNVNIINNETTNDTLLDIKDGIENVNDVISGLKNIISTLCNNKNKIIRRKLEIIKIDTRYYLTNNEIYHDLLKYSNASIYLNIDYLNINNNQNVVFYTNTIMFSNNTINIEGCSSNIIRLLSETYNIVEELSPPILLNDDTNEINTYLILSNVKNNMFLLEIMPYNKNVVYENIEINNDLYINYKIQGF